MTSTDDSGAFAFDEVPAGEYTISVSDYASVTPIVVVAATDDER